MRTGLEEELELERYGVEFIDLPIMASNLNCRESPPAIFYANPARMALHVLRHFGIRAMIGFVRLMASGIWSGLRGDGGAGG